MEGGRNSPHLSTGDCTGQLQLLTHVDASLNTHLLDESDASWEKTATTHDTDQNFPLIQDETVH